MTNIPLRQLMNECAEIHKTLNLDCKSDIARNVTAVTNAVKSRHEYLHAKEVLNNM